MFCSRVRATDLVMQILTKCNYHKHINLNKTFSFLVKLVNPNLKTNKTSRMYFFKVGRKHHILFFNMKIFNYSNISNGERYERLSLLCKIRLTVFFNSL